MKSDWNEIWKFLTSIAIGYCIVLAIIAYVTSSPAGIILSAMAFLALLNILVAIHFIGLPNGVTFYKSTRWNALWFTLLCIPGALIGSAIGLMVRVHRFNEEQPKSETPSRYQRIKDWWFKEI